MIRKVKEQDKKMQKVAEVLFLCCLSFAIHFLLKQLI